MGMVSKDKRINPVEAAVLYALYGQSLPQVANHLGSTSPTILRALRTLGVPSRSISDGKSLRCVGNITNASKGYKYISLGKYNRKLQHVHVMEELIGRELAPDEVVHHKNHDRTDNRASNLVLMSRGEHTKHHNKDRRERNYVK